VLIARQPWPSWLQSALRQIMPPSLPRDMQFRFSTVCFGVTFPVKGGTVDASSMRLSLSLSEGESSPGESCTLAGTATERRVLLMARRLYRSLQRNRERDVCLKGHGLCSKACAGSRDTIAVGEGAPTGTIVKHRRSREWLPCSVRNTSSFVIDGHD
jgi:hypothetical protein